MLLQCFYNGFQCFYNCFQCFCNTFTMLLQLFSMLLQWFSMLLQCFYNGFQCFYNGFQCFYHAAIWSMGLAGDLTTPVLHGEYTECKSIAWSQNWIPKPKCLYIKIRWVSCTRGDSSIHAPWLPLVFAMRSPESSKMHRFPNIFNDCFGGMGNEGSPESMKIHGFPYFFLISLVEWGMWGAQNRWNCIDFVTFL